MKVGLPKRERKLVFFISYIFFFPIYFEREREEIVVLTFLKLGFILIKKMVYYVIYFLPRREILDSKILYSLFLFC